MAFDRGRGNANRAGPLCSRSTGGGGGDPSSRAFPIERLRPTLEEEEAGPRTYRYRDSIDTTHCCTWSRARTCRLHLSAHLQPTRTTHAHVRRCSVHHTRTHLSRYITICKEVDYQTSIINSQLSISPDKTKCPGPCSESFNSPVLGHRQDPSRTTHLFMHHHLHDGHVASSWPNRIHFAHTTAKPMID